MGASITFTPTKGRGVACSIRSPQGRSLSLSGALDDVEPVADGHPDMRQNRTLLHNLWAYGKFEKQYRLLRNEEKRQSYAKQARAHAKVALGMAQLVDFQGAGSHNGWCSACLTKTAHRKLTLSNASIPGYLCSNCGSPTLGCAAPRCPHMAIRGIGSLRLPRYCAEHRHDIPGFAKADSKIGSLENYGEFLKYQRKDLARGSRLAGAMAITGVVVGTGGLLAAPAIGGAIGSLVGGYTGAAATSYGLALLGGGSLAAGGLGMAGGTAVVAGVGGALGGGLGAQITTAYAGADKSFGIEKVIDGSGVPVVVSSGFLTQGGSSWGDWEQILHRRYPTSPVYRVHWGSKELKVLGGLISRGGGKTGVAFGIRTFAAHASKSAAKRIPGAAAALLAVDLAANPWHTAKVRADTTGVLLAGLMARTIADEYILVGHSLGARVMVTAAQTLATDPAGPKVKTIHLLGAALGAKGDWRTLNDAVTDAVYNYHSVNDKVLKFLYTAAQAGSRPVGLRGFGSRFPKIKDRNVSRLVSSHSDYCSKVKLA
jgi:pimeloyl-ACP methyl ester carboxylesterase